jgi:putative DNA primase/helicase
MNFAQFAQAQGLLIRDLHPSNRIRRCSTEKHPHHKNGAYLFTGDRGWCQDWSTGEPVQWWQDKDSKPWTDAEKREWANRQRVAEKARIQGYAAAAEKAALLLSECRIDAHAYLRSKQLADVRGMIAPDGSLMIPMRDCETNQLIGLQTIKWEEEAEAFSKKFLPGMRAKRAVYRIGSSSETILCEGYATGLSIHAAVKRLRLNASVVCCFSASNMVHVAKTHGHFVMADNDRSKTGEQAAAATGLPWLMPDTVGEDWNDVHSSEGLMAVCKAVMELRKARAVG